MFGPLTTKLEAIKRLDRFQSNLTEDTSSSSLAKEKGHFIVLEYRTCYIDGLLT